MEILNDSERLPEAWLYAATAFAARRCRHALQIGIVAADGPRTWADWVLEGGAGPAATGAVRVWWGPDETATSSTVHRLLCGGHVALADRVEALVFHVVRAVAGVDFAFLGAEKPVNAIQVAEEVAVAALDELREDPNLLFDAPDPPVMEDLKIAMARHAEERRLENLPQEATSPSRKRSSGSPRRGR